MNLTEIKESIVTYQTFTKDYLKNGLDKIFQKADYCDLLGKTFTSFPEEDLVMYLGVKNATLYGFLTNANINYTQWNETTKIHVLEFKSFTEASYNTLKNHYSKVAKPNSSHAIDSSVAFERIENWKANKITWIENVARTKRIAQLFLLPIKSFQGLSISQMVLALTLGENQIDLISTSPSGLYDISRPVPPYKPRF